MNSEIIWKPVVGYEGFYEISSVGGLVKSLVRPNRKKESILKHKIQKRSKHHYVRLLRNDKTQIKKYIHTLVLEAFGCVRPLGLECRHLDGNPANNNFDNLKWGTHQENMQDSIKHGTFKNPFVKGSKHPLSVLNEEQVIEIKALLKNKKVKQREIAKKYNTVETNISNIKHGRSWNHV
jgi:hypothetical protein